MPTPPLSKAVLQEAVNVTASHNGNVTHASAALGISRGGLQSRLRTAEQQGIKPGNGVQDPDDIQQLKLRLKRTEQELSRARESNLDERAVHNAILKLSEQAICQTTPEWVVAQPKKASHSPGIPTLFASDWHWGETVDKSQIGGVNEYNLKIARARARRMVETTIDLLRNHMVQPTYPGVVFALGGDMVSGSIHAELEATNEAEIMPVVLDLFGTLCWCIETLAEEFGNVFVPAVAGNHGRITDKIRAKGRSYTNFDWLVYSFLAKRFESDPRVEFMVPNGPDALFRIYGHRYLLCHGDTLGRGGDGIIGHAGNVIRGDHRKRSRNSQIDQAYDTLMCGHFHQLMQVERFITNGSLIGYNEFSNACGFSYEPPRQALWITNAQHGITFSIPVNVGEVRKQDIKTDWVSWSETK